MTTYEEAVEWIHSRLQFGIKPGLARMNWMLEKLGNPERRITCVHIAGTNGKGSTLTYMQSILQAAEYKVGSFTSPYMESFNERISINGIPIQDEEIAELVMRVKPIVEELEETDLGAATEFEVITLMALYYFGRTNPCDIVLFETGLGGRLDSTNVVYPIVSVITTIGYDHMHVLGESLAEIATEKAGIVKAGVPVVTGVLQPEAMHVIHAAAQRQRANVYQIGEDFSYEHIKSDKRGETFSLTCPFGTFSELRIAMKGAHQVHNAALAVMALFHIKVYKAFLIDEHHVRAGLQQAFWIGRFEQLSDSPAIVIDGAHNPEGIASLVETVQLHFSDRRITVLFSALGDKKAAEMIAGLETIADRMLFTTFDYPRAVSPDMLAAHCRMERKYMYDSWRNAVDETIAHLEDDELFLITGSLYFISEVRKYIGHKEAGR